jgi:hypothetical protein
LGVRRQSPLAGCVSFAGRNLCPELEAGVFAYGGLPKQLMQQLKERITELNRDHRFRMVRRD